ncbi:MAG: ABC-F family ATP-binding cassette domain-containing protein [Rubrivivax sp.]
MITLRGVTLRRGVKVVLERADFTLNPGEKAGLVGRNGAGKSSLFALLADRLHADQGDVARPQQWRVSEVAQEMPETQEGATEFVLQGDAPLQRAQAELALAQAADDGHAMAQAHLALEEAGAFDARARAQAMLLGLGFRAEQLDAPVNSFSGGWRMRLQLARALMCPAELLLLDEPTNHLDLDALVWLESWLQRWPGTVLVISHDREFLDAVTQVTWHVEGGALARYAGGYTAFESMRAQRLSQARAAFDRQQERVARLQRFIDRFKAKATKARQAQSRVKALERMERLAPVLTSAELAFDFPEPPSLPDPMLALREVACGYGTRVVVRGVTRTVRAGQRIGILGANGQGKSTLVKTLAGELPALAGTTTAGKGLAIGYFAQQELDLLHGDDTALQLMVRLARERPAHGADTREQGLRNHLGMFRFEGDMVHQPVGTLSGGERARLALATIVWQRPNLLLLDEPTNHLDLPTRQALSVALNGFEGTVLLVSHDRALLREVCDEFWLVAGGTLTAFDGDLDDYQRWLLELSRERSRGAGGRADGPALPTACASTPTPTPAAAPAAAGAAGAAGAPAGASQRDERRRGAEQRQALAARTRPLRVELQGIDARLARLAAEREELQTRLSGSGLAPQAIAEDGRRLNHVLAEVAVLEERWLELRAALEALGAG